MGDFPIKNDHITKRKKTKLDFLNEKCVTFHIMKLNVSLWLFVINYYYKMCAVSVAFFKVFGGHRSFCGVTDTPLFWSYGDVYPFLSKTG